MTSSWPKGEKIMGKMVRAGRALAKRARPKRMILYKKKNAGAAPGFSFGQLGLDKIAVAQSDHQG